MAKKRKGGPAGPALGRSPLPKKTGGAHKTPFDYDRRKWKKLDEDDAPGTGRSD